MTDLRTRIAAVLSGELCRQQHAIDPDRQWQWLDMDSLADAVIRELKLHVVLVGDFQTVIKGSYPKPLEGNDD